MPTKEIVSTSIKDQIKEAIEKLEIARQDENLADPDHIEVAIEATNIAKMHLNNLLKKAKLHNY